MKLKIHDRLLVLNILPKEGNLVTVRLLKDILGKIGLAGDEIKDWKVQSRPNNQVIWDNTKQTEKEIEVSDSERELIFAKLEELNKASKLTLEQLNLYDKFNKK